VAACATCMIRQKMVFREFPPEGISRFDDERARSISRFDDAKPRSDLHDLKHRTLGFTGLPDTGCPTHRFGTEREKRENCSESASLCRLFVSTSFDTLQ
jgi:hypothetical protein